MLFSDKNKLRMMYRKVLVPRRERQTAEAIIEIRSGAGTFEFVVGSLNIEDERIVIRGSIDEWDARAILEPSGFRKLLILGLQMPVLRVIGLEFFRAMRFRKKEER